ncbi:kunitz-type serine protease inhibitor HNTX-03141017-like [Drosophila innubila]|uniref:kunitz-type serine protease inhibitor HNTX-03141017-like n=1 Tax=Drosophila innubila TaxID=198719 RepID=UPI00148E27D3|nr:kunitz-type serine protease inhibitor HNTX-03141017-like [Drosophila innubila]
MNIIVTLALLTLFVSFSHATHAELNEQCRGFAVGQTCQGFKNRGVSGWPVCRKNANNEMWYFDTKTRKCKKLAYKGCGGNKNRFCSRISCIKQCKLTT